MNKKQLRESLNRFDHLALDSDTTYYDFVNLFEAIKPEITDKDQQEMTKFVKEKDYDKLNTYMNSIASRAGLDGGADDENDMDNMSAKMLEKITEHPVDDEEAALDAIYDEEELSESRNTLKPKKCKANASGKTYWSPFDTQIGDYAKFGIRFQYDSKEACLDAINDAEKDLGYAKGGKSWQNIELAKNADEDKEKAETKNESLLHENEERYTVNKTKYGWQVRDSKGKVVVTCPTDKEAYEYIDELTEAFNWEVQMDNPDLNSDLHDNNTVRLTSGEVADGISQLVKKPINKSGAKANQPKPQVWLLIKIYKYTNNGNPGVSTSAAKVLRAAGDPNPDITSSHQVWWTELTRDGLIVKQGDDVWPTNLLKPFIEGTVAIGLAGGRTVSPYDFRVHEGRWYDPEVAGARAAQGSNSEKSHPGPRGTSKAEIEVEPEVKSVKISDAGITKDRFKNIVLEDIGLPIESPLVKAGNYFKDKVLAGYRKELGLEEDVEITPDMYDANIASRMCSLKGWPMNGVKAVICGGKKNESK